MKYLLSVWTDENFVPIQLNGTIYAEDGSLYAMRTWATEAISITTAIYEVADALAKILTYQAEPLFDWVVE